MNITGVVTEVRQVAVDLVLGIATANIDIGRYQKVGEHPAFGYIEIRATVEINKTGDLMGVRLSDGTLLLLGSIVTIAIQEAPHATPG